MRVLFCNKYDFPFSGTEAYLFELMEQMEQRGHETALFSMEHGSPLTFKGRAYRIPKIDFKDPNAGPFAKVRMAAHALYSPSARRAMRECIADFAPDVAHVRSIYHHLSPSILWELRRQRIPVLYHLNDFKILCPTYNFVSHGEPCTRCKNGFYHVITERCYGGAQWSAAVLAAEAYLHQWLRTYEKCVDLFLAPSEFVRAQLISRGLFGDRIEVLPHFQTLPSEDQLAEDGHYLLYFGRLSAEKGLDDLLHAMARVPHIPVVIAGEGPERGRLEDLARSLNLPSIHFVGYVNGKGLEKLIARCTLSVFPSHAFETLGKSILESYAFARPVVASDRGSRRELVEDGVTGLLYPPGDPTQLAQCITFLFDHPDVVEDMGKAGRARLQATHDPEQHLLKLCSIYTELARRQKTISVPRPYLLRRSSPLPSLPQPSSSRATRESRSVKVAFIGGRGLISKYSGIESYYEQVGRELALRGHEVTVYCRSYFTPALPDHNGMRIRRLPTIRTKHMETLVHTFLSTLHAMVSDCDVVHYHCLGPALFSFLPRLVGKKTVVTVQGLDWQRAKWGRIASRILRWGETAAVALPNAAMVVSQTLQRYYRDRHQCDTIYVSNGATPIVRRAPERLREWELSPADYVLFLGRFSPEKNCHLLLEAFQRIRTNAKLVFAGGSSHSDSYVQSLRRYESDRIRFLPWVSGSDLEELISNAALFVLPSDLEGLSLALLDAMAAGVCVLTSDIPENREVVSDVGFMFRRGDVDDLERMLDLLLHNPELRRGSGMRGQKRIREKYQWPEIAREVEKVYYGVLGWATGISANDESGCDLPIGSAQASD